MGLIVTLVFIGVFALVALVLSAIFMSSRAIATRQALATLDSAIKAESPEIRQILDIRKDEQLSSIPWLNTKLHQIQLAPHLRAILNQAALNWSAGMLLLLTGVCFIALFYLSYLRLGMVLPSLVIGLAAGAAPYGWVMFKRSRRFAKFEAELPEALDLMVSAMRAGHSLIAAMGLVARECADPVNVEFRICFEEQNYGLEMKTALENLLVRVPIQDLRIVATAIMIQKESGGNLAEVLDKTSGLIRDRFRLKRQIKVHTAQGRLTGWVLTLLPVAVGFLIYLMDPKMMSILWHRATGIKLLWTAIGMILIGGFVISRIVDIDV